MTKQLKHFAFGATQNLADANFLSTVFSFEHGEAEHADEGNQEANEGECQHLTNETELLLVEVFQLLIEEFDFHFHGVVDIHDDVVNLLTHFFLVHACCDAYIEDIHIVPFIIHTSRNEECQRLGISVQTGGTITHILAKSNNWKFVFLRQDFLVEFHPRPCLMGGLIDDVATFIMLIEIATFLQLNAHGVEIMIIHKHTDKIDLMVRITTSPSHISIRCTQSCRGIADILDACLTKQFATDGFFLS